MSEIKKLNINGVEYDIGGGGGGTTDYTDLDNKPKINGIELSGNKTTAQLGIEIPTKTSDLENDSGFLDDTDTEEAETLAIDDAVTEDSTNLITSGAVFDVVGDIEAALNAIRGVS